MDVIMVGALFSERISDASHHGWAMDVSVLRTDQTMHVIKVGPWVLSSQNAWDHGRG